MKTNKIPLRQYIAVLGITIAAFIFNTSEFMPIGLLSDIASNFQQTEAETGIMITAYAWVVAVLSLPLMLMVTKMELKKLLIATITLFCIGQIVSGSAVNFYAMIALCILWGIASMSFNITLQSEVMQCVPIRANAVAMSMYSGIFNLGIGSGTWFGGYVTTHYTIGDIGYAGGGIAVIAVIYCLFQVITQVKRREHIHTT